MAGSKKEDDRRQKRLARDQGMKRRITFLKRYVKKGYSIPKILSMLAAYGLGISKTSLYSNEVYVAILKGNIKRQGKMDVPNEDRELMFYKLMTYNIIDSYIFLEWWCKWGKDSSNKNK